MPASQLEDDGPGCMPEGGEEDTGRVSRRQTICRQKGPGRCPELSCCPSNPTNTAVHQRMEQVNKRTEHAKREQLVAYSGSDSALLRTHCLRCAGVFSNLAGAGGLLARHTQGAGQDRAGTLLPLAGNAPEGGGTEKRAKLRFGKTGEGLHSLRASGGTAAVNKWTRTPCIPFARGHSGTGRRSIQRSR